MTDSHLSEWAANALIQQHVHLDASVVIKRAVARVAMVKRIQKI
jgi:hypothetical protein